MLIKAAPAFLSKAEEGLSPEEPTHHSPGDSNVSGRCLTLLSCHWAGNRGSSYVSVGKRMDWSGAHGEAVSEVTEESRCGRGRACQCESQYVSPFHGTKLCVFGAGMRVGSSRQCGVGTFKQAVMGRQPGGGPEKRGRRRN